MASIKRKKRKKKQRQLAEVHSAPFKSTGAEPRNFGPLAMAMNAIKTLFRFAWAMAKIAYDCFRHPLSNTRVNY